MKIISLQRIVREGGKEGGRGEQKGEAKTGKEKDRFSVITTHGLMCSPNSDPLLTV